MWEEVKPRRGWGGGGSGARHVCEGFFLHGNFFRAILFFSHPPRLGCYINSLPRSMCTLHLYVRSLPNLGMICYPAFTAFSKARSNADGHSLGGHSAALGAADGVLHPTRTPTQCWSVFVWPHHRCLHSLHGVQACPGPASACAAALGDPKRGACSKGARRDLGAVTQSCQSLRGCRGSAAGGCE